MPSLTRHQRIWYAAIGILLLGLLLVTRLLPPSESGMGTHQKLGLPPCTAVVLFGIPCPTCGMTTSWAHFTRGHFIQSWHCNPGGLCLGVLALATGFWAIWIAIRGHYRPLLSVRASSIVAMAITAITLVDWMGRIF